MTWRKRRNPTPSFRMPTPFQPMSGEHLNLRASGLWPYCALMQVAAEDTHRDYVICRGFDTRINKFIDYEEGNDDKPGIPVAKPYSSRMVGMYTVGNFYAAALPVQMSDSSGVTNPNVAPSPTGAPIRLGQNPGVAATSEGHPADLGETVNLLATDEGVYINWMFIESPISLMVWGVTVEDHPGTGICFNVILGKWCPCEAAWLFDCDADPVPAIDHHYTVSVGGTIPEPEAGAQGWFMLKPLGCSESGKVIWQVVTLDCDSRGACETTLSDGECPAPGEDPCVVSPSTSVSSSPSASPSQSPSASSSPSSSASSTPSGSSTASGSPSTSPSSSPSTSASSTPSGSSTASGSPSTSPSMSPTESGSSSPSTSASSSPSTSASSSPSGSPSSSPSKSPSSTPSASASGSPSTSVSKSPSNSPSTSVSSSPSSTPSHSPSMSASGFDSTSPSSSESGSEEPPE